MTDHVRGISDAEQQFMKKATLQAAETLMRVAMRGTDGVVYTIDALATLHATILMKLFPGADWNVMMKTYVDNVGDKIIAVNEAMIRELQASNDA